MQVSYNPLWEQLKRRAILQKEFQKLSGLGSSTMTKLRNDDCVTTDTLLKICEVLGCDLDEVLVIIKNNRM